MKKVGSALAQSVGAGKKANPIPVKIVHDDSTPAGVSPDKKDPLDSYEVKDHLDTLQRAHGIMNDPDKMANVHKLAGRHMKALTGIQAMQPIKTPKVKSLQDLKDKYSAMTQPGKPDADGE